MGVACRTGRNEAAERERLAAQRNRRRQRVRGNPSRRWGQLGWWAHSQSWCRTRSPAVLRYLIYKTENITPHGSSTME